MTTTSPDPDRPTGPLGSSQRIVAIDALRGVAVLGILVMNIYAFAMPYQAYSNPLLYGGTEWHNLAIWFVTHALFDQKFMTIFSLLFGAGIVIMQQSAAARGSNFRALFKRRQFWLAVIGALHGYLFWIGDILFHYALIGLLVAACVRWTTRSLIVWGCVLLAIAPLLSTFGGL